MQNICEIFNEVKSIAVVGISDKPNRDSGLIASFLKENGFDVVGVHPNIKEAFGIKVFKSLIEINNKVDLVDIFLSSDKIPLLVEDIIKIKPKYVWLQLGISNDESVKHLIDNGINVIKDRCIAVEYRNCKIIKQN